MPVLLQPNLYTLREQKKLIEQSIQMNTTANLFWSFYDANRLRCVRYAEDNDFRQQMRQDYLEQCYLEAMVAKKLINKRPIKERLKIFRNLKQELSGMISGEEFDRLEGVVLPNPFNNGAPCRPWGVIPEEKRLQVIAEQRERIGEFIITFLG